MRVALIVVAFSLMLSAAQQQPAESERDTNKSAPPVWQKEPDQFKGVSFDATSAEAKKAASFSFCQNELAIPGLPQPVGQQTCILRIDVTEHYSIVCYFKFQHDRLQQISGDFPSKYYEEVRGLFITKYGDPLATAHENVQTNAGAVYEQESLTWRGKKICLFLSRFGDSINDGSISFIPTAALEEQEKKSNAQKSKALQ